MANRKQPGKKPRKEGKRNAKPSGHLIVTEGIKTEVHYFNGFKEEINRKFEGTIESYTIEVKGAGKETIRIIEDIEDIRRRSPHLYAHTSYGFCCILLIWMRRLPEMRIIQN